MPSTERAIMKPSEIDTSKNFIGTFGCIEFEAAAVKLVKFLTEADDNGVDTWLVGKEDQKDSWERIFRMYMVGIEPTMFAMLCACGWIEASWFPKYAFYVSEKFVERVCEKWGKNDQRRLQKSTGGEDTEFGRCEG